MLEIPPAELDQEEFLVTWTWKRMMYEEVLEAMPC